jgi:hypothetical protein
MATIAVALLVDNQLSAMGPDAETIIISVTFELKYQVVSHFSQFYHFLSF